MLVCRLIRELHTGRLQGFIFREASLEVFLEDRRVKNLITFPKNEISSKFYGVFDGIQNIKSIHSTSHFTSVCKIVKTLIVYYLVQKLDLLIPQSSGTSLNREFKTLFQ